MANLFLDGIFDSTSKSPSTITIRIPVPTESSFIKGEVLRGLIVGDPTWSASNKWGPLLNDLSNLQDWASLLGEANQFSWISASTMCWKGTSPLTLGVEFYLINYSSSKSAQLRKTLSNFVKLASVGKSEDGSTFKVRVHGGYAPELFKNNMEFFSSLGDMSEFFANGGAGKLDTVADSVFGGGTTAQGSISITFGHKSTIRNLLLSKVDVTESTVEVAGPNGENPQPLYYRVNAQFVGVQPLVTTDVDYMFGTTTSFPQSVSADSPPPYRTVKDPNELYGGHLPT